MLLTYNLALVDLFQEEETAGSARIQLRRLRQILDLSFDDLGRMLHVSGETVRRWESGMGAVPAEKASSLASAGHALRRLQSFFRPESLSSVVRREVELFGGDSAIDWILSGRIQEVADRYDLLLRYQG
jgi:transcriptional regulator with XRE-family HTH domain